MNGEASIPTLHVRLNDGRTYRFARTFRVGRAADCDVQVDNDQVSRKHLLVSMSDGHWTYSDLQSANGVFEGGVRVTSGTIGDGITLRLGGEDGPAVTLEVDRPVVATGARRFEPEETQVVGGETMMVANYQQRYFGNHDPDEPAGPRTMYIRKAFQQVQKKQRRQYAWVIGAVAAVALTAGGYALYVHQKMKAQEKLAADLFYYIKETDVRIAKAEQALAASGGQADQAGVQAQRAQRLAALAKYDQFLQGLDFYGRRFTEEERLILRVTRMFGECELLMPREYLTEVGVYIKKWKSTKRFTNAVNLARNNGYTTRIAREMAAKNLPEQFFYLAMQESNFDYRAVGTPTRYGFAKGMWQFIPGTARDFGLKPGPRYQSPSYDPDDERFQWEKASEAAAKYIKFIYATDAQASGLLVMASYNWGQGNVLSLIRKMPDNPRDRNFWKLLEQHRGRIPKETYDYVFSIVSAAVIGENPRLFGFDFDNPLAGATPPVADAAATSRHGVERVVVSASR
jgi:membrane-bound lytic murein transglycosylase D